MYWGKTMKVFTCIRHCMQSYLGSRHKALHACLYIVCVGLFALCLVSTINSLTFPRNQRSNILKDTIKQDTSMSASSQSKTVLLWDLKIASKFRGFTNCSWNCLVTTDQQHLRKADMVLFSMKTLRNIFNKKWFKKYMPKKRWSQQQWVLVSNESPVNSYIKDHASFTRNINRNVFNLTMTYMKTADISIPYGSYTSRKENTEQQVNDHRSRTKLVLWFVSNCKPLYRLMYSVVLKQSLKLHLDIYGKCSGIEDPCSGQEECIETLTKQYKFYLAFENSRCQDYITEKFWNTLKAGMVPIVIGPSIENYKQLAPPNSFIHVDNFTSPEALADYLLYVNRTPKVYAAYHAWREEYEVVEKPGWWWGKKKIDFDTGEDGMWCKVCKAAHQLSGINKTISLSRDWNPKKLCGSRSEAKFLKEYKN